MSVRPILQIGDPELRRVAEPVDPDSVASADVQLLVDDLIDTMRHARGAGLAATQIGVPLRVAVLEVQDNPRYPYKPKIPLTVAINPRVEPLGDEVVLINEGCLSIPIRGDVPRFVDIRVQYLDRHGRKHDTVAGGLTAGTWQHEVDHLDGVLLVDRVTDPRSFTTWAEFQRHHKEAFLSRVSHLLEEQP